MATPIVVETLEDGTTRTALRPKNLEANEGFPLRVLKVSEPRPGEHGDYAFAEIQFTNGDGKTETAIVLVSASTRSPGFITPPGAEPGDKTGRGKNLLDLFNEVPLNEDLVLVRFVDTSEAGREFSTYWLGTPRNTGTVQWARQ